jgi:hypothetical protein
MVKEASVKSTKARSRVARKVNPSPPTDKDAAPGMKGLISWEQNRQELEIAWRKAGAGAQR